jgi:hypothetical protein
MIVAGPHDSSRAFPFDLSLWRSDHTPPIAKRSPTHCEMALSWAVILKRLVFTLLAL